MNEQRRISILLIDNNEDIHKLAVAYFDGKENYHLYHAEDATHGVKVAKDYMPDVIVCDVELPGRNGFDLLNELNQHERTRTIPVIMISGNRETKILRSAGQRGADAFLPKPFLMSDLEEVVCARVERLREMESKFDNTLSLLRTNIAYALPHELRTPLAFISGYAQILEMHGKDLDDPLIMQYAGSILGGAKRLHHVIENHLVFTQLQLVATDSAKREALRNSIIKVKAVIEESAAVVAHDHDRTPDLDMQLNEVAIRMSQENLSKIIYELVDNACKFSEQDTPISIKAGRIDKQFLLEVRDHGRGMKPEQAKQIGAYIQFDRQHYEQQGLGLGLTIVKQLVDLHEGEFEIRSVPERGTLVRISLPL